MAQPALWDGARCCATAMCAAQRIRPTQRVACHMALSVPMMGMDTRAVAALVWSSDGKSIVIKKFMLEIRNQDGPIMNAYGLPENLPPGKLFLNPVQKCAQALHIFVAIYGLSPMSIQAQYFAYNVANLPHRRA
ncbi:hypothetical protein V8J88_06120 [Massilia sp. W12]|uniref:hypothetical protein n=1 Tax=Massilia sp. W12 TaxID=3126507 RepID=UPI0030D19FCC